MFNLPELGHASVIVSLIIAFGLGYGFRACIKRPWRRDGFW